MVSSHDEIIRFATNYFKDLFSTRPVDDCERLLSGIHVCVSVVLNEELMAEFKTDEVVEAARTMAPLSAHLGTYPSYIWRSIWGARNLIEAGTGWRIDNRLIVNIWNDVWVRGPGDSRLKFQNIDIRYTTVSDLIDVDTATWKNDVIKELFGTDQLKRILLIRLASSAHMDEMVWRTDRTGEYTAHSGYKWLVIRGYEIMGTNITPQNENLTNFYMRLWNLSISSKICIHFWRVINDFVPTRGVLKSRKLAVNSLCLVCELEKELVVHLFRDCGFSKQVLEGVGVDRSTDNMQNSWKQWLVEKFMKASILECRKLAISFWALWYNCNKINHEGVRDRVQDVVRFINAYLMEIDQLNNLSQSIFTPEQTAWEPPEGDAIKFNFDASFS